MLLIYILICLFILLLGCQAFLTSSSNKIIEGLTTGDATTSSKSRDYKPYNVKVSLHLAPVAGFDLFLNVQGFIFFISTNVTK